MPVDEMNWHCTKLYDQLMEEKRVHDEAMRKAKSKSKSHR